MAGDTHYEVLGVEYDIDAAALRKAYVAKAREFHPDFHASESAEIRANAEMRMRLINTAWEVLGPASSRASYDKELRNTGRLESDSLAGPHRSHDTGVYAEPEYASGSAPPRWLTMVPILCLFAAVVSFALGIVTGLPALLAGAVILALVGAVMFVVAPLVALKRSKQGSSLHGGPTIHA
jgi:hypothetical protein